MGFWTSLFGNTQNKKKVNDALFQTKQSFINKLAAIFSSKKNLDSDVLEQIEEVLFSTDIHSETIFKLLEKLEKSPLAKETLADVLQILKQEVLEIFLKNNYYNTDVSNETKDTKPFVALIVGVNGVGKTTSIGKLAFQFKQQKKAVMLGAADTFRAAAAEQLFLWSKKIDVAIVKKDAGADPSSVVFDTIQSAMAKQVDVVLIDTAGRLHNKTNLMEELGKITRVIKKIIPNAPHEVLLVLDGTTGQNAIVQAKEFLKYTTVTGLIVTKLDGSAKGGFLISIIDQLQIPVKFIGVGEGVEDLIPFEPKIFLESFFNSDVIH